VRYKKACDNGDPGGCALLGFAYEKGTGVPQDNANAKELFQKACDGGEALGYREL
jgi:TPR repeat protein